MSMRKNEQGGKGAGEQGSRGAGSIMYLRSLRVHVEVGQVLGYHHFHRCWSHQRSHSLENSSKCFNGRQRIIQRNEILANREFEGECVWAREETEKRSKITKTPPTTHVFTKRENCALEGERERERGDVRRRESNWRR
jgi:hypothetical protein